MTIFELVSGAFIGLGAGLTLAVLGKWRWIGIARVLALGLLGGLVGSMIGIASGARGPTWGELAYRPMAGFFALLGGASAVGLMRLLVGRPPEARHPVAAHRRHG